MDVKPWFQLSPNDYIRWWKMTDLIDINYLPNESDIECYYIIQDGNMCGNFWYISSWYSHCPNRYADIIYYSNYQNRDSYWEECSKYAFVVSPHGNGLDCIRTFESLSLGCIVIVKKSDIDALYNELPVLIVDEWHDITEGLLHKTLYEFSNKTFNMEKITMAYWLDKVNKKCIDII